MATTRKFQIEVLRDRKITEQIHSFQKHPDSGVPQRVISTVERVVPESYMVYFPHGHSIWVENKQELARLQLLPHDNIEIDTDTGLPVVPPQLQDLKALSDRKTVNTGGK